MPSFKLIYFNARGGGELSRLVFAAAGEEYEDIRLSGDDWKAVKPDQPLQALPVLEVDGVKFCQGAAIARYLAREFGLMGESNLDQLRIDELQEASSELFQSSVMKMFGEKDERKKEELRKTTLDETLPRFCKYFEMRLCQNGGGNGFFIGSKLSLGDLLIYNMMQFLRTFLQKDQASDPFAKFDKLKALYDRVDAEPKIAAWVKKRPVTSH